MRLPGLTTLMVLALASCQCTQLPPDACFLDTCDAGTRSDGGSAERDAGQTRDAGVDDAGTIDDSDAGQPTLDAGQPLLDAGVDAGRPPRDAGTASLVVAVTRTPTNCLDVVVAASGAQPAPGTAVEVLVRSAFGAYESPAAPCFGNAAFTWVGGSLNTTTFRIAVRHVGDAVIHVRVGGLQGTSATIHLTAAVCRAELLSVNSETGCWNFNVSMQDNQGLPLTMLQNQSCAPSTATACPGCGFAEGTQTTVAGIFDPTAGGSQALGSVTFSPSAVTCPLTIVSGGNP